MNQLDLFLDELRRSLATLPADVADGAVQYYREYFADASQAGVPEAEILRRTGPVEQVAAAIADDTAITAAERRPGPFRLLRTTRRVLGRTGRQARATRMVGAARAARGTSLAIASVFPLSVAILLYLTAFAVLAATAAVCTAIAVNLSAHPLLPAGDRVGQIGLIAGLAAVGLMLMLLAYRAGHFFGRLTLGIFRSMVRRPALPDAAEGSRTPAVPQLVDPSAQTPPVPQPANLTYRAVPVPPSAMDRRQTRSRTLWRVTFTALLVVAAIGWTLATVQGLPQAYLRLWNSQRPADVQMLSQTLGNGPARTVQISTLNSNVIVLPASDASLGYAYEQLPYYQLEQARTIIDSASGLSTIQVSERANGRLPLIEQLSVHEGTTTLTVYLPAGAQALELTILSNGGDVDVHVPSQRLTVRTATGDIRLHGRQQNPGDLVSSSRGTIFWLPE